MEGAEDGDTRELFSLYREIVLTDAHLQNGFGKRKLAVLGDALSIQPRDKKQADKKAAEAIIEGFEGWEDACIHLLDSTLLPVAVIEKVFRPSTAAGLRYELAGIRGLIRLQSAASVNVSGPEIPLRPPRQPF